MQADLLSQIRSGGILYILLLIAVTMHEFGHAWVADKLGDRLPRMQGRVTINPVAHMDFMGTFILPIMTIALSMGTGFPMVFGWGKPVVVMLDNPKTRVKVDLLSTAGGVAMNLVLALIFAVAAALCARFGLEDFAYIAIQGVFINCVLFVINMIPVPPLDGSHFLKYATKMSDAAYMTLSRYGVVILLAILLIPQTAAIVTAIVRALASVFLIFSQLIFNAIS